MSLHWHILGAGNLGTLAAFYLRQAGFSMCLAGRPEAPRRLTFPDGRSHDLLLPGDDGAPIRYLILATKAAQSLPALAPLRTRLGTGTTLIRLQNGLGSLDDLPPPHPHIIDAVANSGAWREPLPGGGEHIHLAAENTTLLGDGRSQPPSWFAALADHWPQLRWRPDIRLQQWLKLSLNAVINPLTALHDCDNGALLADSRLQPRFDALAEEIDALARRLLPEWPGETAARARALAQATAGNTSSMRADVRAGRATEIHYINGYLLRQAEQIGMALPEHQRIVAEILALHRP